MEAPCGEYCLKRIAKLNIIIDSTLLALNHMLIQNQSQVYDFKLI